MDVPDFTTGTKNVYSLWHIPSSALLLTTVSREEIQRRITVALADGFRLSEMMLQVTTGDDLIGKQHLGDGIAAALSGDGGPTSIPAGL